MMTVAIHLTAQERTLAEQYARKHRLSLSEAFKQALFELIEDEEDIAEAEEAYAEYVKSGYQSWPIEQLWKELGLDDES